MGKDIYTYVVKNGGILKEDLYTGRHQEWFNNMCECGDDPEYSHLQIEWGLSPQVPQTKEFNIEVLKEKAYFDFHYVNVGKYLDWFDKYQPNLKAGWLTTYDAWLINNKGYIPEYTDKTLPEGADTRDWRFSQYIDTYDPSGIIAQKLLDVDRDADFVYWFDN